MGAGAGAEGGESLLHGDRISVWGDGEFWRRTVGATAGWGECASRRGAVRLETVKMVNYMLCVFYHNERKNPGLVSQRRGRWL